MFEIYYTGAIILLMTVALVMEISKPSAIVFIALMALYLGGVVSMDVTFSGFSNHGMLTVGLLFVVAAALQSSTAFERTVESILGNGSSTVVRYLRLMFPVSLLSAFLNNTPVVASLIPVIKNWARKNDYSASKFLIPLSYAAILGGTLTLIGTSTNLVVHGLMLDHKMEGFGFFEMAQLGFPVVIIGTIYFSTLGYKFLPARKDILTQFGEQTREFVVALEVYPEYEHIGRTIEEANLRNLKGLYLFQIIRGNTRIAPVSPQERIKLNDRLFFTGMPETIYELQKTPGLHVMKDSKFDPQNIDSDKLKTYEVVISNSSPLIGETVKESNFRKKYNAVILGIHRSGERINRKVGEIELRPNDTLFLLAEKDFEKRWYHTTDFSLVSLSVDAYAKPRLKGNLALFLMALMIIAVGTGIVDSMLIAASLTAAAMILTRIISFHDARNSIDFDVLIVIASALGIGRALESSGLADVLANGLINLLYGNGILVLILGIFFLTSIYTELITNNAAAALMFPVALATANKIGVDPRPFMLIIAIAASASFSTPLGYQTNLMVYNPGGYKFRDFLQTGFTMNILVGLVVSFTAYFWFFN